MWEIHKSRFDLGDTRTCFPPCRSSLSGRKDYPRSQPAAEKRGIGFHAAEAHVPDELDRAIRLLVEAGVAFMCIEPISMLNLNLPHIAQSALRLRLPTITKTRLPKPNVTGNVRTRRKLTCARSGGIRFLTRTRL
jgi:hypothetical protein